MDLAGGSPDSDATDGDGYIVDIDSLATIRAIVAMTASDCGLSGDASLDLVLAVNELATNVIQHGGGTGRMWIWSTGDAVYCRMRDAGPGMISPRLERPPRGSVTGRGLWMIQRMTDKMEIQSGPEGTTVTIAIPLR